MMKIVTQSHFMFVEQEPDRPKFKTGGSDEELYFHDAKKGVTKVPRRTLALDGLAPTVEGRFDVKLASGDTVAAMLVTRLLERKK